MKQHSRQSVSLKNSLQIKPVLLLLDGLAFALTCIFLAISFLGTIPHETMAKNNYPFNTEDEKLKKVNFTILNSAVNSSYEEVRPFISPDGNELFFSRRHHPENIRKAQDKQDIWVAQVQPDGLWATPKNPGEPLNTKGVDAVCSISPDGSEVILINGEMDPAKLLTRFKRDAKGWSSSASMEVENLEVTGSYIDAFYSYEFNLLILAIQQSDSQGEQDLYVSFPKGINKWSPPINLGSTVNTSHSDFAPFLAPDGKTLYFVSYGHNGLGGCDIYMTRRLDETWQKWSEPVNLGEGINSPREESYFSISRGGQYIYFESYDTKEVVRDIFRADLPASLQPEKSMENNAMVKN